MRESEAQGIPKCVIFMEKSPGEYRAHFGYSETRGELNQEVISRGFDGEPVLYMRLSPGNLISALIRALTAVHPEFPGAMEGLLSRVFTYAVELGRRLEKKQPSGGEPTHPGQPNGKE